MITKKNISIVALIIVIGGYSLFAFNKYEKSEGKRLTAANAELKSELETACAVSGQAMFDLEVAEMRIEELNEEAEWYLELICLHDPDMGPWQPTIFRETDVPEAKEKNSNPQDEK